jgi:hypothetical protein
MQCAASKALLLLAVVHWLCTAADALFPASAYTLPMRGRLER